MIEWNRKNIIALVMALLSLACGGVIYLAFRSEDLLLYKAIDACGGMSLSPKCATLHQRIHAQNGSYIACQMRYG